MAEKLGPRSVSNIVFIILLFAGLAWGLAGVVKFISAASGGTY